MKVLLIQDVDELGLAGEVKEVAAGYGRNYLIPQGLAVLATKGALKEADLHRRRAAEKRERIAAEMATLADAVRQTTLVFQAKAGEKGRLYGSITTADIAEKLGETVGQEIDRRRITLEGTIKEVGAHRVSLRLSADTVADFDVMVESVEPEAPIEGAEPLVEAAEQEEPVEEPLEEEEPADEPDAD
jgi:large subunit ribosomal protein L9